jgi:MoaA/NifB/PqqE/SkfB family radical SAM enzyme
MPGPNSPLKIEYGCENTRQGIIREMLRVRPTIMPLRKEHPWYSLVINLTNRCNQWCKYCFQESTFAEVDKITLIDVERVLDFLAEQQRQHPEDNCHPLLQLTGGEIFLHPEIFEIIQLILRYGYTLKIQTNGILFHEMSDQQLGILSSDRILIKVSLDGWNPEVHEWYRPKGFFDSIISGITTIRRYNRNIGIKTIVHEGNFPELYRMLDLCLELSVKGFTYALLRPEGRGRSLRTPPITELDVVVKLIPYFNQKRYQRLLNGTNIIAYYLLDEPFLIISREFYIDFDGGIYPDQGCIFEERIGSIFAQDLSSQFDLDRTREIEWEIPPEVFQYVKQNLFQGRR